MKAGWMTHANGNESEAAVADTAQSNSPWLSIRTKVLIWCLLLVFGLPLMTVGMLIDKYGGAVGPVTSEALAGRAFFLVGVTGVVLTGRALLALCSAYDALRGPRRPAGISPLG